MVLSFVLCASFVFAQSNMRLSPKVVDKAAIQVENTIQQEAGYTGTIFTKDVELFNCSFAAENQGYTTGVIGNGELIDGTAALAHVQTKWHATWHRIADTSTATCTALRNGQNYPYTFGATSGFASLEGVSSETPNDGLMLCTMQDQISDWGGEGAIGVFNTYIKFGPIATTGYPLVRVRFNQYYRKFYDNCYVDYSTDGTTWSSVEVNVTGIDVSVNGAYNGQYTQTMPTAVANSATVYFRLRYFSDYVDRGGGAYGYIWIVDDFKVIPSPENYLNAKTNSYYEGFYQLMPQNFQVPVVWKSDIVNDGQFAQNNVQGKIFTYMDGDANATAIATKPLGTINSTVSRLVLIDPLGFYDSTGTYHGEGGYYEDAAHVGPTAYLPTSTLGVGHFFANINSDAISKIYGDTATFDTLRYEVNFDNTWEQGRGSWGRDNGALRKFSYYAAHMVAERTFSTSPSQTPLGWASAGYGVFVSYTTGNTVPEGWRILGVEMVAATREGMNEPGTQINPVLWYDIVDSGGGLAGFNQIATGAPTYTVQESDVIRGTSFQNLTYRTRANTPTIFIPFPNQPELEPMMSYRVGYELPEDGNFAVAIDATYYYTLEDSSAVYFRETPGMQSYGHKQDLGDNVYNVLIEDPYGTGGYHIFSTNDYPMIRMVVGPSYFIQSYGINFECENADGEMGAVTDYNYEEDFCGGVDSVYQGSNAEYYIVPNPGYKIAHVYVDGAEFNYTHHTDAQGDEYGSILFENIQGGHTVRVVFEQKIGFDPIANAVSMKLQPNPATSNVHVTLSGVSGMVNMALIDMSGRVITTSQFNAENGANINVSNLAKGAYFVRITNDKFSKVEKLIVR